MEGLGGNRIGSIDPVVAYLAAWLLAFIWFNIRWSVERRRDEEFDGEDITPPTVAGGLIAVGARVATTGVLAALWPYLVLAFLWNCVSGLFSMLRPRRAPD